MPLPLPEPIRTSPRSGLPPVIRTVEEATDAILALPDQKLFSPDLWAAQEALFKAWKCADEQAITDAFELFKAALRNEKWLQNPANSPAMPSAAA